MKRVYIFAVGVIGVAVAAFFMVSQGTDFSFNDWLQTVLSYFRRGVDTVTSEAESIAGQDDAYTKALTMIAGFEGFSGKAYADADGFSIGYGHFLKDGDGLTTESIISESDAYALLQADAQSAYDCVSVHAPIDSLSANQIAALISLVYNIGCGAFQSSTLLKKLNAGDIDGAGLEFARWNKSGGRILQVLVNRRQSEAEVFTS